MRKKSLENQNMKNSTEGGSAGEQSGRGKVIHILAIAVICWLLLLTVHVTKQKPHIVENQNNGDIRWVNEIAKLKKELLTLQQNNAKEKVIVEEQERVLVHEGIDHSWRFKPEMGYLDALDTCQTLKCIREAHKIPHKDIKYNFPHFFIAGYSKSASTSLYQYLNTHPETLPPKEKEPILLTEMCSYDRGKMDCPYGKQREYIEEILKVHTYVEKKGAVAPYQATPRVMDLGVHFAEILREYMPWLKLVSSMREPISRSMSKYIMAKDKFGSGCLMEHTLVFCLRRDKEKLYGNPKDAYYSRPLKAWLDNFPTSQILLMQYEEVVAKETQSGELTRLKEFLGLDVEAIGAELDFGRVKCRHCEINPEGWPMKEKVYRKLIELVMPDVLELVRLIDLYNLGNGTRWFENWAAVWDSNLDRCVNGQCNITLS